MSAPPDLPWSEANQQLLAAELARLRSRLLGEDTQAIEPGLSEARAALSEPAAIDQLSERFGLSSFERDLLLLCAGVEMDAQLATACATASGAPSRQFVTFGLGLTFLADPHWSACTPVRPLRRWRLLELKDEQALSNSRLSIDERVLHYLAGVNYLDPRLRPLLRAHPLPAAIADAHSEVAESIVQALSTGEGAPLAVQLTGDDAAGQKDVAAVVADRLGMQLHVLRAAAIPSGLQELEALAVLWYREAALLGSALLISCDDATAGTAIASQLAERQGGLVFVSAREALAVDRSSLRFTINKPGAADQKALWIQALGTEVSRLNGALDGVATQFHLSADTILHTGEALRVSLPSTPTPDAALWQACRDSVRSKLDDLSQRVDSSAQWDDLILPESHKTTLRQIAAHVKHRFQVYDDWGFAGKGARGLGISALFAGESGTGKTMAAEVLANELHLDLYRIDLSSTVSKYIGETEKNLRRLFDAAEDSGAILLFDEADALFGKRSEVKESLDRYANIEVSYLLQRMEAYRGLAILTTNQKSALDTAFARRLRFIVPFSFPDQTQREQIWRGVFPTATPLGDIDYGKLARLSIAGGSIRNIALNAAFLAAQAEQPIGMTHLLGAARGEASKRERPFSDAETRGWV